MTNALLLPGHRVCEYKLIIPFQEALKESIIRLRASLHDQYKIAFSTTEKPALTVLHCYSYEGMEEKLFERVQQVASHQISFKVELENFSSHSSHTIFIRVADRSPFYELAKELKVVKALTKIPGQEPSFITEPHVEVAQKLKPFQFIRIWMDCEQRRFTANFLADRIVMMKRSVSTSAFEEVQRFSLASQSSRIRQGVLFA